MLKKPFLLILLVSLTRLYAGGLSLSDTLVNFNDVFVGSAAQATISLINNGATTIDVRYTNPVEDSFTVLAPGTKVAPGDSLEISLTFMPKQNIAYTDFLFLRLSAGQENLKCKMLGNGRLPNSYYADSFNKWGAVLKSALHNIIKGHTEHNYSELWDILSDTDEDPNNPNNVLLLYTGWSSPKNNHGGGGSNWNREHVWAKSHGGFGTSAPAGTDVHHIRPTDVTVNSARGNLDFDNGGNKYTDGDGTTDCYYDNDSWEPRSAVKGDVARMMYYMAVRYEADATNYDLELIENIPSSGSTFAKRSTLYSWHKADPVDDWERSRNEKIYTKWQHNRNPFIDYPQFIDRLPSISGKELSYDNPSLVMPADSIIMAATALGSKQSFTLNLANTGGTVLNIRSMQVFDNHFTLSKHSLSIPAESDAAVTLSFSGDNTEGVYSTNLQIDSDDPLHDSLIIPLKITVSTVSALMEETPQPLTFELGQNYPNPFNPLAVIPYTLSKAGMVTMEIFNVHGELVQRLTESYQPAGRHTLVFDGRHLTSGVYYYTLRNGRNHSQTRKMILLK